jgi:hypothetical protein
MTAPGGGALQKKTYRKKKTKQKKKVRKRSWKGCATSRKNKIKRYT